MSQRQREPRPPTRINSVRRPRVTRDVRRCRNACAVLRPPRVREPIRRTPPNQLLPRSVQVIVVDQSSTAVRLRPPRRRRTRPPRRTRSPHPPRSRRPPRRTRSHAHSASSTASFAVATVSRASDADRRRRSADEGPASSSTLRRFRYRDRPPLQFRRPRARARPSARTAAAAPSVTGVRRPPQWQTTGRSGAVSLVTSASPDRGRTPLPCSHPAPAWHPSLRRHGVAHRHRLPRCNC